MSLLELLSVSCNQRMDGDPLDSTWSVRRTSRIRPAWPARTLHLATTLALPDRRRHVAMINPGWPSDVGTSKSWKPKQSVDGENGRFNTWIIVFPCRQYVSYVDDVITFEKWLLDRFRVWNRRRQNGRSNLTRFDFFIHAYMYIEMLCVKKYLTPSKPQVMRYIYFGIM